MARSAAEVIGPIGSKLGRHVIHMGTWQQRSQGPFSLNYLLMGKLYKTKVVEPLVWLDVGNVKSVPGPQPGVR